MSHHSARFYDPALGRWHSVDPLSELTIGETPYHYVSNNPVNSVDPSGLSEMKRENGRSDEEELKKLREERLHPCICGAGDPPGDDRPDLEIDENKHGPGSGDKNDGSGSGSGSKSGGSSSSGSGGSSGGGGGHGPDPGDEALPNVTIIEEDYKPDVHFAIGLDAKLNLVTGVDILLQNNQTNYESKYVFSLIYSYNKEEGKYVYKSANPVIDNGFRYPDLIVKVTPYDEGTSLENILTEDGRVVKSNVLVCNAPPNLYRSLR